MKERVINDVFTKKAETDWYGYHIRIYKNGIIYFMASWTVDDMTGGWSSMANVYGPDWVSERNSHDEPNYCVHSKDSFSVCNSSWGERKKSEAQKNARKYFKKALAWIEERTGLKNITYLKNQ